MKPVIYIDTEDDSNGNFLLGVIYDDGKYHTFKTRETMQKYITSKKSVDVYAHNVAYDIGNVFDIRQVEYKFCKSKFISGVYSNNGCYIRFFDGMNLLPVSLRSIGETLGIKKLDMKKDDLETYCRRDVEILKAFVENIKDYCDDLGVRFSRTLSSISWNYFKKTSGQDDIKLPVEFDDFARKSYFGGRVEIFRMGKSNRTFYENDVNSMYPYSMKIAFPNWKQLKERTTFDDSHEGVADVLVEQSGDVPLLPVRNDNGVFFVTGRFRGTYTYNELRHFEKTGGKIIRIYRTLSSRSKVEGMFDEFVNNLFERKTNEPDANRKLFFKLMLNSLYGKTGFAGDVETLKPLQKFEQSFSEYFMDNDGRRYAIVKEKVETNYQNVLIASYITAEARINLHNHLTTNYSSAYYCDTDSVITDKKIVNTVDTLGALSLKRTYKGADFLLPKFYRLGEKVKAKGFRSMDVPEFNRLKLGETIYTKNPVKIRSALRFDRKVNVWNEIPRSVRHKYDKRVVLTGGNTRPMTIKELEKIS